MRSETPITGLPSGSASRHPRFAHIWQQSTGNLKCPQNSNCTGCWTALLGYALELCDAEFGLLFVCTPTNGFRATYSRGIPQAFQDWFAAQGEIQPGPETGLGRMAGSHEVVNIVDVRAEEVYRTGDPLRDATVKLGGARSFTAIPMLAGKRLVGAFTIYRQSVRPFDEKAMQLARMFADQSVIAIENARMMSELRSTIEQPAQHSSAV